MDEAQLTQEAVAERTGKDRAHGSQRHSPPEAGAHNSRLDLKKEKLTAGHGPRPAGSAGFASCACAMRKGAARGGLTVRQIERLASRRSRGAQYANGNSSGR